MAHLLFGMIVRRLHVRLKHEPEIVLRHVVTAAIGYINDRKTRSKIRGFFGVGRIANNLQEAISVREHRLMKTGLGHLIAAVPGRKQPPRPIEQVFCPGLGPLVGVP